VIVEKEPEDELDGNPDAPEPTPALDRVRDALERIASALKGLKFGTVTVVVQDGVVVQVERTEKVRLERPKTKNT
jgi:hypothetical protein